MKYEKRGVSASKSEVHQAIQNLDKGLFPNAFCKILPDLIGHNESYANVMHADTAGTKPILSYLLWKETGDMEVWSDIIQDALVMNLDDMACVGITNEIVISSTIGRNKHLIPGEVLEALIQGTTGFIEKMANHEINLTLAGGETADVGDIVRTLDVGFTTFARIPRSNVIDIDIQDGDVIVGFASSGQASYEDRYNSGIGSNGLTSARHDVLSKHYDRNYPEAYDPNTEDIYRYIGKHLLNDEVTIQGKAYHIGKLLTAPTRTYLPLLHQIVKHYRKDIHGIIHCTGGAHTKVMKFVHNKRIIKDNFLPTPPVFELIQSISDYEIPELYSVFNMGHRLELYVPKSMANELIDIANSFSIEAQIIGRVELADHNELIIESSFGNAVI